MEEKRVIGEWKKEKILGTGGFGTVVLWINTRTQVHIALKECRWGHDAIMTAKHRQRWKLEVDIMKRLSHPHVVKAVAVPPQLDAPPAAPLPLMAMEYCNGGDLRKVLSRPENCCGLPEPQVRAVLRNIVSAVGYLHSMRIVHRDLKPENIVMQDCNGKQTYKLIDLGYAKELDQGSLCTSFVGTLQYLAPELFLSQTYTCTVDFWSLGLVTHEVMTGQRPFLPTMSPAQWIPVVRLKSSDDITAHVNSNNKVEFSTEISPFHRISSCFKTDIEDWLRVMLDFDADNRGRRNGVMGADIFHKLIDKKVLQIFCLNTLKMFFFEASGQHTISDMKTSLSMESRIPVDEQLLLLPKGNEPELNQRAINCWANPEEDDIWPLFLLSEKSFASSPPSLLPLDIPSNVEKIMCNPKELVGFETQRVAWREAIFLSQQLMTRVLRLTQGFKTCVLHLLRQNSHLNKSLVMLQTSLAKLKAKADLFRNSLRLDLKMLQELYASYDSSSCKLHQKWNKAASVVETIEGMSSKMFEMETKCSQAGTRTLEPQRSPFARSKHSEQINEMHNSIVSMYGKLKKKSREQRAEKCDNTEMVRNLCGCIQFYETQSKELLKQIGQISSVRQELCGLLPQLEAIQQELNKLDKSIVQSQEERQRDVWRLASKYTNNNITASSVIQPMPKDANCNSAELSVVPLTQSATNGTSTVENKRLNPFNDETDSSGGSSSLGGPLTFILGPSLPPPPPEGEVYLEEWTLLLGETARSSQRLRQENADLRNSLGSMLTLMTKQQEEMLQEDEEMLSIFCTNTRL